MCVCVHLKVDVLPAGTVVLQGFTSIFPSAKLITKCSKIREFLGMPGGAQSVICINDGQNVVGSCSVTNKSVADKSILVWDFASVKTRWQGYCGMTSARVQWCPTKSTWKLTRALRWKSIPTQNIFWRNPTEIILQRFRLRSHSSSINWR